MLGGQPVPASQVNSILLLTCMTLAARVSQRMQHEAALKHCCPRSSQEQVHAGSKHRLRHAGKAGYRRPSCIPLTTGLPPPRQGDCPWYSTRLSCGRPPCCANLCAAPHSPRSPVSRRTCAGDRPPARALRHAWRTIHQSADHLLGIASVATAEPAHQHARECRPKRVLAKGLQVASRPEVAKT